MKKEIAEKWVAALRSGEYKQGTGTLKQGDKYCCLGVLCDLHRKENGTSWNPGVLDENYLGSCFILKAPVLNWIGAESSSGDVVFKGGVSAMACNDGMGESFEQIAARIEDSFLSNN